MSAEHCSIEKRVAELVQLHGSLRKAAAVLKIDHAYLQRLGSGEKIHPSHVLLKRMNLREVLYYERAGYG